jgi:hypothetical protein
VRAPQGNDSGMQVADVARCEKPIVGDDDDVGAGARRRRRGLSTVVRSPPPHAREYMRRVQLE